MKKYIKIDKSKNEDLLKKAIIESTIKEMEKEYPNFIEIKGEKYILSRKGISRMVYLLDNYMEEESFGEHFIKNNNIISFNNGDFDEFYTYYNKVAKNILKDYKEFLVNSLLEMIIENDKKLKFYIIFED